MLATLPTTTAKIELRPYQLDTVNKVVSQFKEFSDFTSLYTPEDLAGDEVLQRQLKRLQTALVVLPTGCHQAGQGILMYDGSIKGVEDIQIGDVLMGADSTPKQVLALHRGQEEMIEICPVKGDSWTVNKGHILSLTRTNQGNNYPSERGGGVYDVPVSEWLGWRNYTKNIHKLFRVRVDFPQQQEPLPMHPYLLGVILGDGGLTISDRVHLTNPDKELVEEVDRILHETGSHLQAIASEDRCQSYHISWSGGPGRPKNGIQTVKRILNQLGLLPIRCEHRFIPHAFKAASKEERLQLLAGLLDTDGYQHNGGFEYSSKSLQLTEDVMFVARSLGLAAYKSLKQVNGTDYYRVSISGDCSIIPARIPRKQAPARQQKKDVLRTGFTCRETGTIEKYYGFTVDGDHRYLLADFTVTHNCGKTIVFCNSEIKIRGLIEEANKQHLNTLIIAHRQELLTQARDKYHMLVPDMSIGLVGDGIHEYGGPVTVASVQTISQPKHLARLKHFGYQFIIIDEAHHCISKSYQKVLDALPQAFRLYVTATPDRLDGKPVIDHPPICSYSIIDMIEQGYLCNLTPIAIRTETNLNDIKKTAGDYNERQLAEAVDNERRNARIAESYQEHCAGRQFLCFSVTVQHAYNLAQAFQSIGVRAEVVSGKTSSEERARLLQEYEDGQITGLINCGILVEGYDDPGTSCVIMARPTQSRALFTQMTGRGLRLAQGKQDCILLDITDNIFNHKLQPPVHLSDVLNKRIGDKESVLDALVREEREEERRKKKQEELDRIAQERIIRQKRRAEDAVIDLLQKFEWTKNKRGYYILEVGEQKHRIALIPDSQETAMWRVSVRLAPDYQLQWLYSTPVEFEWAQSYAEQKARQYTNEVTTWLRDNPQNWRNHPASVAQIEKLDKWKVAYPKDENGRCLWTKGEASDAMDKKIKQFQKWGGKKVASK